MAEHLTIPGALEWDAVERHSIATLRYAGGKEHDVKYVSEVAYDALKAELKALREAQKNVEPVRWERMSVMRGGKWWPCADKAEADAAVLCGWKVRPLYAEPPAPPVVLPAKLIDTWSGNRDDLTYDKGFNDAIEATEKLNGLAP